MTCPPQTGNLVYSSMLSLLVHCTYGLLLKLLVVLQREASSGAGQVAQVEWSTANVSSEQLSLELHHVEREIGMRTREMAMVNMITVRYRFLRSSKEIFKCLILAV